MGEGFALPRAGTTDDPVRLALLVSGGGSGLAALLRYQQTPRCHATVLVVADSTDAGGLEHGRDAGVRTVDVPLPMDIDKSEGRLRTTKLMPGVSHDDVLENTGFDPTPRGEPGQVAPPTPDELRLLREEVDPGGVYLKNG